MSGDGRRIGVLVPWGNTAHEREFNALRSTDVQFAFRTFCYPASRTPRFCDELAQGMIVPARELAQWGAELIVIGCTTASMICAAFHDSGFESLLELPVVTAATAMREVIEAWDVPHLAVATPYGSANNAVVIDYLHSLGVRVTSIKGLDLDRSTEAWRAAVPALTPQRIFELAKSPDCADAQAVYLPCTAVGSLDIIDELERATGKAVFSAVLAAYWASLERLNIDGRRLDRGRLLREWNFAAGLRVL